VRGGEIGRVGNPIRKPAALGEIPCKTPLRRVLRLDPQGNLGFYRGKKKSQGGRRKILLETDSELLQLLLKPEERGEKKAQLLECLTPSEGNAADGVHFGKKKSACSRRIHLKRRRGEKAQKRKSQEKDLRECCSMRWS